MTISAGTKLGSYEVIAMIGAGGMGEVYQARDTKLGRDVAIKVLPAAFAHDSEKLSRFEREAKVLASLNHPNIASIYGLEESAGLTCLVMELVPGETLAEKIKREGAIPVVEVQAIARQIAEALEAAHEKGIVHRDLKPANVKVTPDGKVKVLDFGLAKALADDGTNDDIANSPTMSHAATMQGIILGTAAYMSPEQARGKKVDRRADIWSFGVVLYEMLTGEQLFAGETVTDTLAHVITREPDWDRVPARMQHLLRWCLEKDPKKRLRDVADGMATMDAAPEQALAEQNAYSAPKWLWAIAIAGCLATVGLGGIAAIHLREKPPAAPAAMHFQIRLPNKVTFTRSAHVALSPDGRRVAFPADGPDGHTGIWVQDLDAEQARQIRGANPTFDPPPISWSPDSRFVVYGGVGKIQRADVSSGEAMDICERPGGRTPVGFAWNSDGIIVMGTDSTGLWKVPASGGTAVPLTVLDVSRHEREHELPVFLPDGRHFLYLRSSGAPENSGIYVGSLEDSPERQNENRVLATGFGATYVPTDDVNTVRLLFLRDGSLMEQGFDVAKLKLLGEAFPVVERVGSSFETAHFSATPNVLVYRERTGDLGYQLTWFNDKGNIVGKAGDPAGYFSTVRISPDGTRVAYAVGSNSNSHDDIWLLDIARNASTRFTFGSGSNLAPVWSPDGSEIVFASNRDGTYNLYRKPVDGAKAEQPLLRTNVDKRPFDWSRDGRFLVYAEVQKSGIGQPWALPMRGEPTPISLSDTTSDEIRFEFSPDGRRIAYQSYETGQYEIYVRDFNGSGNSATTGGKWMISKDGGFNPRWRADGKQIVYTSLNQTTVMSLSVDTSRTFQAGPPQALFDMPADRGGTTVVAPTPDQKRFLFSIPVEQGIAQSFTVLLNWASVVKK
jgi:Tol biopolymer transport system component